MHLEVEASARKVGRLSTPCRVRDDVVRGSERRGRGFPKIEFRAQLRQPVASRPAEHLRREKCSSKRLKGSKSAGMTSRPRDHRQAANLAGARSGDHARRRVAEASGFEELLVPVTPNHGLGVKGLDKGDEVRWR